MPAGASIHDRDFFPELARMLEDVNNKLARLTELAAQLEASSEEVAAAAAPQAEDASNAGAEDDSAPGSSRDGKHLQWADRQATPLVVAAGVPPAQPPSRPVAADGERSLRKGFRRRTWAGPAWLNSVSSKVCVQPASCALLHMRAVGAGRGGGVAETEGWPTHRP